MQDMPDKYIYSPWVRPPPPPLPHTLPCAIYLECWIGAPESHLAKCHPDLPKPAIPHGEHVQEAPLEVQKKANCIIGKDYPAPIVDHKEISKVNIARIKEAYSKQGGSQAATAPAKSAATSPTKKQKQSPTLPVKSPSKMRKV